MCLCLRFYFCQVQYMHRKETDQEIQTSYFKKSLAAILEILDWASRGSDPKPKQHQRKKAGGMPICISGPLPTRAPSQMTLVSCARDAPHARLI